MLGERGASLSGGQRQRLAIARGIISNPRILVLDDALAAVDPETEHLISRALELVMVGFSPRPSVLTEDALYLASPATLLRRLRRIKEACGTVMVIGHNPGLHELASLLCAPDSPDGDELLGGKFPTLARASFRVETRWAALDAGRNPLIGYVTPKLLGAED